MRERLFDVVCGVMILAGSVLFVNGGRQHPATDPRLGPMGSESYFRAFAETILADHHWESMHGQILAGPILWTLGAVGLRRRLRRHDSSWHDMAIVALTTGAAAWMLAFVFDGFVAPAVAAAVRERPVGEPLSFLELRANQLVVIRSGLIGWMLIGTGIAALSAAMLSPRGILFTLLGLGGLAIGLWPIVAWLAGSFVPGPFVSRWWPMTALVTAAWFALAGATLFARPKVLTS